jgi:hypothetical protein
MLAAYEQAAHPPCRLQNSDRSGDDWSVDNSGQAQLAGRIHNPCTEALDIEIDIQILDRTSQQPIGDAHSATIQGLGPGETGRYSTWAEGLSSFGSYSAQVYWSWHRVADRSTGVCVDVGATRCLRADAWLSNAILRLLNTTTGPQLLQVASEDCWKSRA